MTSVNSQNPIQQTKNMKNAIGKNEKQNQPVIVIIVIRLDDDDDDVFASIAASKTRRQV